MKKRLQRIFSGFAAFALTIFILASIKPASAQIFPSDGLRMPGSWNAWTNDPGMGGYFDLARITSGTLRWQTTFQHTGDTGPQEFKFASTSFGNPWGNQWAGNIDLQINTLEMVTFGTPSEPNNTINITQNNWYTVVFEDNGYEDSRVIFMETAQQPTLISSVTQEPPMVENQQTVDITATLSTPSGNDEYFFLRYTLDEWNTSTVLPMTIDNTTVTATIPGFVSETTVEYYVFSSTLETVSQDFDLLTLRKNNNNGNNYSYIVDKPVECGQQIDVVTTDPAFPRENTSLTIYFNAEMGNGGLFNYDGDVYAHTGVITSESSNSSDWKYVKTNWGENTPETMLTRLDDNLYALEIDDIRSYYGVPASEEILQLAFVFRSGEPDDSGNYREHKNSDNSDIFISLYEPELNVKILSPNARNPLVSPHQVLPVCVEALQNESLSIYLNDQLLTEEYSSSLAWPLVLQTLEPGTHWIRAKAIDDMREVWDSVAIFLRGPVMVEDLPADMLNGINYIDNQTVTLVLHDPAGLKQFAFAIGDYSDWLPNEDNYMKRTPDGQRFWVTLTGLGADTEYAYQYYIDGEMRLPDAYAEKILDPWNDPWIPASTYPSLKPYPFGKTTGIVSIMHPGRAQYQWEVPDFTPVAINETQQDLVIYELLVRDFLDSRHITEVIDKLDYLQDLGVNAIQLMPIMEFDGNDSWGYAPNFFFATDKYYGTRQAYKEFIDACHLRDIAVILDVVPNHAFGQNPMVNMYFDPTAGEFGQPLPENPWFNQQAPHPYSVGYDFNHESPHVRAFFKRVFEYWLTEFNVDGYRIDLSKGLTQNYSGDDMGAWSAYDQSRINILTDYYNHIKSVKPNAYVILEHFAANDEETVLANTGMMLWSAMHDNYKQVAMGYQQNSSLAWAHHSTRGWNYPNLIDYMENHDEERLMFEALTYGNSSGNYNLGDTLTALNHMEMAAVLFLGIPGPKMIWQFGEIGYDYSIFYGGDRTAAKPPRWDYWDMPERQRLHRVYNGMIQLRTHDAFRFGQFAHDLGGLGKRAWVSHESMNVVIAANMGVNGFDMAPGFQHAGTWYNYFTGEAIEVSNPGNHSFYFEPGNYKVFTNLPVPRPFYHINLTVKSQSDEMPLAEAMVKIERAGTRETGADGTAYFTQLPGEFEMEVSKPGFKTYLGTLVANNDLDLTILLQEGDDVSVNDPVYASLISIYPNPASAGVTIQSPAGSTVTIYNTQGQLTDRFVAGNEKTRVDISGWPSGIYLIRVVSGSVSTTARLMVK